MKRTILILVAFLGIVSYSAFAQVEQVLNDTIANSGTLKGTRIYGEFTAGGADDYQLIVTATDSLNARLRLIAVGLVRNLNVELSADTINLGFLVGTAAKQWRFNLDTLLRGTKKNQAGATPQTAWQALPYKVFVELVPQSSKNAVQGGTSSVKRVQVDVRRLYNRGVLMAAFEDTLQNSGTLKGSKIIGGSVTFSNPDSAQLIITYSDSAAGYIRLAAYSAVWPALGARIASDTVFLQNITAVAKGQIRLNWTQIKALTGAAWLAFPLIVSVEFIPDGSGNAELPVGGSDGLQPKWIRADWRLFAHRN